MFSPPVWSIPKLSNQLDSHFQANIDNKTKPPGSLGKLETLAMQLARIQLAQTPDGPLHISNPTMLIFAADHGIARHSVSIAPAEVTQQMVSNFIAGGAAINCFCRLHDITLKVIDAGMLAPVPETSPDYFEQRVGAGTSDISEAPAMSFKELELAFTFGATLVRSAALSNANVVCFGEMGIGNTSTAAALLAAFLGKSAQQVTGRGTGITEHQYALKVSLIEKALQRTEAEPINEIPRPYALLASLGGFEIVQMVAAMLASAEQGKVIIVDGFIVTVAALYACAIAPEARQYMVFAHVGAERSHQLALEQLDAVPLLDLGLRLGEGTGAALAVPLLRTAAGFYNEMATFESANVNV